MKKCAYCGRENEDTATNCVECGTAEFATPNSPVDAGSLSVRLLISVGVGLAVSSLSLYVAWQNLRDETHIDWKQSITRLNLGKIDRAIRQLQSSNAPPRNLAELRAALGDDFSDGWQRPFIYLQDGTNFTVVSYGRDGAPGGNGLDSDLTSRSPWPKGCSPTLLQFYLDLPTSGIKGTCIACGVVAFATTILTVRAPNLTREGLVALALKLGVTVVGAVIVAAVISALHIPSH